MPKVTPAHLAARREQILEAACRCFSDKGFHPTTMRDICDESGLSAGAIYRYFESKDEILEALAGMGRRNTRALLDEAISDGPAPRSLAHLLDQVVGLMGSEASRTGARLDIRLWGEALSTPRIRELFLEALPNAAAPFEDLVRRGQEAGDIAPELDPETVARVLIAVCLGLQVQKAMEPALDLEGWSPVLAALLEGTFRRARDEP